MLAKLKKKYIGDWDFYKKYLLLAIPMILSQVSAACDPHDPAECHYQSGKLSG